MIERQQIPDLREYCASCSWRVEEDAPAYRAGDRIAHVRCPFPWEKHAFLRATHVGDMLYGFNPPARSGTALSLCRCGMAFAAPTNASAKGALARHLRESA